MCSQKVRVSHCKEILAESEACRSVAKQSQYVEDRHGLLRTPRDDKKESQNALTPFVIARNALTPFVIARNALTPFVIARSALTPFVIARSALTPFVIARNALTPFVIARRALTPFVIARRALTPFVIARSRATRQSRSTSTGWRLLRCARNDKKAECRLDARKGGA